MRNLDILFVALKREIENQLGREIYSYEINNGRGWGLSKIPYCHMKRQPDNFAHIVKKIKKKSLLVAVKKKRADELNISGEIRVENGSWQEDEARWYVPIGNDKKLQTVANYLVKMYQQRWP